MKPQKSPYLYRDLTAIVLLIAGIVMAFIALFLPPPGEIHESVLFIFAQILIYAGSIFGIDAYIRKAVNQRTLPNPPAPRAFANAAPEGVEKNVTDDTNYLKHQREYEHLQDPEHRRNPNDRGDPEEED